MKKPVRIANVYGFWGDRLDAAADTLGFDPTIDYLTLDFLAEVSMSVLAAQQHRGVKAGYCREFLRVIESLVPYWRDGGRCRLITNAGGLDPLQCAEECANVLSMSGCGDKVTGVVTGDDVKGIVQSDTLSELGTSLLRHLDSGASFASIAKRLVTANAYLGARPIVDALRQGADIVITGRVADPSLAVAPAVYHHGWSWNDWDRLAAATVAGHLIECGTQVTGGISTDWLDLELAGDLGYPIVEVSEDGSLVVTRPHGTGGVVNEQTVKEQLLYEIGDPAKYLSPDVTVSFQDIKLDDEGNGRVHIAGAQGQAPSDTLKISATYRDGYWTQSTLTIFGRDAYRKAERSAEIVFASLRRAGMIPNQRIVECLGSGDAVARRRPSATAGDQSMETVLRIAVADPSKEVVERFAEEMTPLITGGPQGTTGYAEGRPRVHPMFRFWPCLIERSQVTSHVQLVPATDVAGAADDDSGRARFKSHQHVNTLQQDTHGGSAKRTTNDQLATSSHEAVEWLGQIAHARSGDKGCNANIGVIARSAKDYPTIVREVTADRVAAFFGLEDGEAVTRYELPSLGALNFVVRDILANPLRIDAQGKALGQALLEMPLQVTGTI